MLYHGGRSGDKAKFRVFHKLKPVQNDWKKCLGEAEEGSTERSLDFILKTMKNEGRILN